MRVGEFLLSLDDIRHKADSYRCWKASGEMLKAVRECYCGKCPKVYACYAADNWDREDMSQCGMEI